MKRLGRWLVGMGCILAVVVGWVFAADNAQLVEVRLLGFVSGQWRLGFWLLLFAFVGLCLGLLSAVAPSLMYRRRIASLKRKNAALEKQLQSRRSRVSLD